MSLDKHQTGFTLIELVVVIIILGILAVIAAPKFLSLSSDVQTASLEGIAGTIASMNKLAHSKTQFDGIADRKDCDTTCNNNPNWDSKIGYFYIDVSGTRLYVSNGYPKATGTSSSDTVVEDNYKSVMGLSDDDFVFGIGSSSSFAIIPKKFEDKLANIQQGTFKCHVEYRSPQPKFEYYTSAVTDDCF
ncbi:prepilin-type N-terminal cleavage/methylation domain-containing protein [Shewanella psychrophila]|uniref:Prepilin-type N-terminal cleavage/methylation domain-containing protein n=1 Tax=Shewanella psychrophila TaxID=225848 RepID=A0A1S6HP02_9GAMM|nr:prepilin-type N-terminal cleavage/methylation domain-containing protein [Shewanella psychrophila]AQS37250.1 prepilin-type N-terminal cleavage/methylation domain-containing protein [Shewanella psychrophila]